MCHVGSIESACLHLMPTMTSKKILLLSVSAGAGHTRAAEAIRCAAAVPGSNVTALHLDVMDFVTPVLRKIYTDFHISLVNRAPTLWGYLYQVTDRAQPNGYM